VIKNDISILFENITLANITQWRS